MKKLIATTALLFTVFTVFAQEEKEEKEKVRSHSFKKENIFTGGSLILSFSNYTTVLGGSPVIGYSITNWLDAGFQFNYTYLFGRVSYYDPYNGYYYVSDDRQRQTTFGPGAFLKIYPVKFLFVQAQGEFNSTSIKYYPANSNGAVIKSKVTAPSFLAGAGYCNGREGAGSLFYYFSVMVDLAKDENSPYTQVEADGKIKLLPIIRAGLQIPIFQGKGNRN